MSPAALMVRVLAAPKPPVPGAMLDPAVLLVPVPVKVRLLIVKLLSSVVARLPAVVAVKKTLEFRSGRNVLIMVPAESDEKLVAVPVPLDQLVVLALPLPVRLAQ